MKFAVAVWSAHEYSRQLSRRVSLARRNKAVDGIRSGSRAPYGMYLADSNGRRITKKNRLDKDGKIRAATMLIPGKPEEVRIVRWIFNEWAVRFKSINSIVTD